MEVFRIYQNRGSPVLQEGGKPNGAKDSSASRVYESQSAFFKVSESAMGRSSEVHLEIISQLDND